MFQKRFSHKIGIIGVGNLGLSMLKMFNKYQRCNVICSVKSNERLNFLQNLSLDVKYYQDNSLVTDKSNIIMICVKPLQVLDVCKEINNSLTSNNIVVSTAACVPLKTLHRLLPNTPHIVRCMPNIPCEVGEGIVPYVTNSEIAKDIMVELFHPNETLELKTCDQIDTSTIISGCSPAFIAWFYDQIKLLGSQHNLPKDITAKLLTQTIIGSGIY